MRALAARFFEPYGIVGDTAGNLYVTDAGNATVRKITPAGDVITVAGSPGQYANFGTSGEPLDGDGVGTAARFSLLKGITIDSGGNLYVGDTHSWDGRIRKITPSGVVTTFVSGPYVLGLAADGAGNIYAAGNGRGTPSSLFMVTPGGTVSAIQGPRSRAVALDGAGSLYVADTGIDYPSPGQYTYGPFTCAIEKITSAGTTVLAGKIAAPEEDTCGYADGVGAAAKFAGSNSIAIDAQGNVFVADTNNHVIRKVTSAGVATTLAGLAGNVGSADGTGSLARFNHPSGVTLDAGGNLYVTDTGNHTIRRVTAAGTVTTVAGAAGQSGSADVPPDNPM